MTKKKPKNPAVKLGQKITIRVGRGKVNCKVVQINITSKTMELVNLNDSLKRYTRKLPMV